MVEAHFDNIRKKILKELARAKKKIVVAVYWFTNEELFQTLLDKVNSGLDVQLIIHNDYINNRNAGLNFQNFIDSGGKFYFSDSYSPMHHKFCVIDNKTLINGSYNWTYYAENRNRENILTIKKEEKTIKAFELEFERLKSLTEQIEILRQLTKFEVDENNVLRARDYLANDLVYQAMATGRNAIVEQAFKIAPNNIEVQKTAYRLDLTEKWKLKYSIGSSLKYDHYLIIVPKGSRIPFQSMSDVQTSEHNQRTSTSTIHYGENPRASYNTKIGKMTVGSIPPKPAGEAKLKIRVSIDIYGKMRIEKFSLDTGYKDILTKNIVGLLEEEETTGANESVKKKRAENL